MTSTMLEEWSLRLGDIATVKLPTLAATSTKDTAPNKNPSHTAILRRYRERKRNNTEHPRDEPSEQRRE